MTTATRALTVAFLIDRWEPERGGAERSLAHLARHLGARGHRVLAFARRASADAPGEFRAVATGGWSRKSRERALARALVAAAREAGADVTIGMRHLEEVDVFWPHAGAHARGLLAREEARQRTNPTVAEEPESEGEEAELEGRHALFGELERQLCEGGAGRIVCVSPLVAGELTELYPSCAPRLALVPNGIDLEHFHARSREEHGQVLRSELGLDPAAPLIAFLAHDAMLKGLPTLLDALALLRGNEVHLLIGGVRPLPRWKRRAERVLGPSRVHAFSNVDARAALSAADLLVHPTWRDTSGLVILEALAVGTPVITTRRAGDAALVRDQVSGTVLDLPGNPEALARAIEPWIARVRAGSVARPAIRACVAERDQAAWLQRMEAIVVECARGRG